MKHGKILKLTLGLLETRAGLLAIADQLTRNGYVPTDDCPLRATGQHRLAAVMISGNLDPEAGFICPFCSEAWWPEIAREDW